jgi:AcrR family transcriptional regulator
VTLTGPQDGPIGDDSRATRDTWISMAWALLEQGHAPDELTLAVLSAALNLTKGSFYSHFPGKLDELHRAVLDRWVASRDLEDLDKHVRTVRDPLDRLRLIGDRLLNDTQRDGAVRRWAARDRDGVVANAVAEVDRALISHMTRAWTALSRSGSDSCVLARGLMAWFAGISQIVPDRDEAAADLDRLLNLLRDAGEGQAGDWRAAAVMAVIRSPEADEREWVLFMQALGLPPQQRRTLAEKAQELIARQDSHGPAGRTDPAQTG